MIHRNLAICALFALVTAGCAGTPDAPAGETAQADVAPLTLEKSQPIAASSSLVCKRERETGSRVARRVCRTQSEWERTRTESLETIERTREAGATTGAAATP